MSHACDLPSSKMVHPLPHHCVFKCEPYLGTFQIYFSHLRYNFSQLTMHKHSQGQESGKKRKVTLLIRKMPEPQARRDQRHLKQKSQDSNARAPPGFEPSLFRQNAVTLLLRHHLWPVIFKLQQVEKCKMLLMGFRYLPSEKPLNQLSQQHFGHFQPFLFASTSHLTNSIFG